MSEETVLMADEKDLNVEEQKSGQAIAWYRTKIDPKLLQKLHKRSDFLALSQTLGYVGLMALTAAISLWSFHSGWPWYATVGFVFLHGMVCAFMINGVHELCHNTVFKTQWMNSLFVRVLSFLGWINFPLFETSHLRHHRYTLHQPDDLEVTLPYPWSWANFFKFGFVNLVSLYEHFKYVIRIACGKFSGEWETKLFPDTAPQKQKVPIHWARTMLVGHAIIVIVSLYFGWWLVPVLVTLNQFYGGWLFLLCNNTQHIGLTDKVPDFRLCCRTITLNPVVQFLYWHMNYHTEHHMYAAVPCYNLGKLHKAIKHDLPATKGLIGTWLEINEIRRKQAIDPAYQYTAPCPPAQARPPRGGQALQGA
ncbi:MAG: fatty acid desaturase [Verrucomicrobiota bacterium]|nr:fatty acid desaturase [Verrucomicrobiota bacterium]